MDKLDHELTKKERLERRLERVKAVYRQNGYDLEKDFPGEYYFMCNTVTGEKVRLYYWGNVEEYR